MKNNEYVSADIAQRVKAAAKDRHVSIKQMLEDIDLAKGTLDNFKTSMPKADNLAKIADYLNVSVDYLMGRQQENPPAETTRGELNGILDQLTDDELKELLSYTRYLLSKREGV